MTPTDTPATLRATAAGYRDQAAHWRATADYADSAQARTTDLDRARGLDQHAAELEAAASALEAAE